MESDLVKCAFGHSAESSGDLNAEHIGGEHLPAAGALAGADGEHGRQHAAGRMNNAAAVGIVEIEAVNKDAVEKRGVARR